MRVNYRIISKHGLLVQKFSDDFCMRTYECYLQSLLADPHWSAIKAVLTDMRGVETNFLYENLEELVRIRKEVIKKKFTSVILIDQPVFTASTMLYKNLLTESGYYNDIYSTEDLAIDQLMLPLKSSDVKAVLWGLEQEVEKESAHKKAQEAATLQ